MSCSSLPTSGAPTTTSLHPSCPNIETWGSTYCSTPDLLACENSMRLYVCCAWRCTVNPEINTPTNYGIEVACTSSSKGEVHRPCCMVLRLPSRFLLWVLICLLPVLVWIMYPAKSTSQYIMHNHHSEIIRWWRASCTCFWWYDVPAAEWRRSRQQTRMQDAQNVSVRRCQQQEVVNSGSSSRLYHGLMIPLMLSDALTSLLKHNENDWPDARGIHHRLFWCSAGWIQLPSPSHQLSAPLNSQFQPEVVPQLSAVTSSSTSLL